MLRDLTLSSSPSRCVPCTPHQSRTDPRGTVKDSGHDNKSMLLKKINVVFEGRFSSHISLILTSLKRPPL